MQAHCIHWSSKSQHFGYFWSDTNNTSWKPSFILCRQNWYALYSSPFSSDLLTIFQEHRCRLHGVGKVMLWSGSGCFQPHQYVNHSGEYKCPTSKIVRMTFPPLHMDEAMADKSFLQIYSLPALFMDFENAGWLLNNFLALFSSQWSLWAVTWSSDGMHLSFSWQPNCYSRLATIALKIFSWGIIIIDVQRTAEGWRAL